ncbi:MAG: BadF/BadG/BcrA/BcrD ATPase family protein [Bacteroidota bacterium]
MPYFIGIDGGGTKTRGILTDQNLKVIKTAETGAANPHIVGFEKSSETLFNLIKNLSGKLSEIFIAAGISGAGRVGEAERLKKSIIAQTKKSKIKISGLEITSDALTALEGAFSGKPGMMLIAGTGSILIYKNNPGKILRVGGYGRLIGDEGSGYSIGRKGLAIVSKSFDKRIKKNILTNKILDKLKIFGRDEFIYKVNSPGFDIASIAPIVIQAAKQGDILSRKILNEEVNELINHIETAAKNFKSKKIPLCFYGGLILESNYYSNLLKRKIKSRFENILIQKAEYPPERGAVLLAKKFFITGKQ